MYWLTYLFLIRNGEVAQPKGESFFLKFKYFYFKFEKIRYIYFKFEKI